LAPTARSRDGRLVAAGSSTKRYSVFTLVRYRANGTLDPSFGSGGKVRTDITAGSGPDRAQALAIQQDGKLVAAGYASHAATKGSNGQYFDVFALVRYRK
jgi:hypothetical protein